MPEGGAEGAAGGTLACLGTSGIWSYIPTQAETNYAAFLVSVYKSGCIPITVTVVTTASATAGYAGIDWAKVGNPTTTLGLSGTTIATVTAIAGTITTLDGLASGLSTSHGAGSWATATGFSTHSAADVVTALGTGGTLTALASAQNLAVVAGYLDSEIAGILSYVDCLPATLNNLSSSDVTSACTSALNSYDPPTNTELEARTLAAASYATAANQTAILGYVDCLPATLDGSTLTSIWTTALAESYGTDGSALTAAQLLHLILANVSEFAIAGTTKTCKKLNGSTTAATYTLDSETAPTAITRTS
jgi:hypothetical protein